MSIRLVAMAVVFVMCGALFAVTTSAEREIFGFKFGTQEITALHALSTFTATFCGVLFSLYLQRFGHDVVHLSWKQFAQVALRFTTPGSLLVATVVYVVGFSSVYQSGAEPLAYFVAFQSGFFFKQTLSSLMERADQGP